MHQDLLAVVVIIPEVITLKTELMIQGVMTIPETAVTPTATQVTVITAEETIHPQVLIMVDAQLRLKVEIPVQTIQTQVTPAPLQEIITTAITNMTMVAEPATTHHKPVHAVIMIKTKAEAEVTTNLRVIHTKDNTHLQATRLEIRAEEATVHRQIVVEAEAAEAPEVVPAVAHQVEVAADNIYS